MHEFTKDIEFQNTITSVDLGLTVRQRAVRNLFTVSVAPEQFNFFLHSKIPKHYSGHIANNEKLSIVPFANIFFANGRANGRVQDS